MDPDYSALESCNEATCAVNKKKNKRYQCPKCCKIFQYQYELRYHVAMMHTGEKIFCREKCGESF